ncbi:glycosyltransferase family 2 protein [Butyrivibrio sp. WCD3002]|uniref:glycosyltransferase family 2 protein n=1 Tax=Butyrivibrio sp. WCD3002 TaxID=1280676 RepID=UPI00041499B8|nr:glycosyltransferase family 2 protein [Butyrivibrio sp. WCD3002]
MNGQSIEISIIIPVYQAAGSLEKTVASVKEALSYWEDKSGNHGKTQIVLVDDGSSDGSSELCDRLSGDSVVAIHTKNFGVSHARNIGMEKAEGRYISFVDADDTVSKEYIQKLFEAAESAKTPIADMMDGDFDGVRDGYDYIEKAILYRDTHVWGKLFLSEAVKKAGIRFREGMTIGEDMLFLMELSLKLGTLKPAVFVTPVLYNYLDNDQGAMKKSFKESYLDQLTCWREAEKLLKESEHKFSRDAYDRLSEIQMMSAMLVAGKIACVDSTSKESVDGDLIAMALTSCRELIESAGNLGNGFGRLSAGYKLKVLLFKISRRAYLTIYGKWKS